jgi:hypothetical protein
MVILLFLSGIWTKERSHAATKSSGFIHGLGETAYACFLSIKRNDKFFAGEVEAKGYFCQNHEKYCGGNDAGTFAPGKWRECSTISSAKGGTSA